MYGEGISKEGNILDVAAALNIVTKTGAWYSYGDLRLGQGRENAKTFLRRILKWPWRSSLRPGRPLVSLPPRRLLRKEPRLRNEWTVEKMP